MCVCTYTLMTSFITFCFPEDSCGESVCCQGCHHRFTRNPKIRVKKENKTATKKVCLSEDNKIWNKDVSIFEKELSAEYHSSGKNHFLVFHIDPRIDVLLKKTTEEVIPASHCIRINQYETLQKAKLSSSNYVNYIIYEVSATTGERNIIHSHNYGTNSLFTT